MNLETSTAPIRGVIDSIMAADEDLFEPLLTAEEAAEHLRIHVKTLQKLAREQRFLVSEWANIGASVFLLLTIG